MRIAIDLQGAQASNRKRGIGRYSLAFAKALARNCGEHEIFIVLNGLFEDTILPIRSEFRDLVPADHIHVWHAHGPLNQLDQGNTWRRSVAEMTREAAIASLEPSVVIVTSLFEGLGDDAVTSIGTLDQSSPTAAILYDLIPALNRDIYLDNADIAAWYENKLEHLRRADLLLSISESSRQEALDHLGFTPDSVTNIATDADPQFQVRAIDSTREQSLRERYQLDRPFAMYTGGIDHRKNIEGLIRAWSLLPQALRDAHQLAIVCSIQDADRQRLQQLARQHGIRNNDIALTGFVPEDDLIDLYNLCKLFVFPSLHEGFGLPALEAMRCGKAVIAANTSSLPEVVGRQDALFDPTDDQAIASKLEQVLSDDDFRRQLEQHASIQATRFSWDETARRAIPALESLHARHDSGNGAQTEQRPRLAFVSPLPPGRSGIADYSAELLPELARHYEIDVIVNQDSTDQPWGTPSLPIRNVEWLRAHADEFDRIMYHFGNSEYHEHMFALLEEHPGVVVLHDFYLSGITAHMEVHGAQKGFWTQSLYNSHGYHAVRERFHAADTADAVWKYPCNADVLRNAQGVIVHSEAPIQLARNWYGPQSEQDWACIPLLRTPAAISAKIRKNARTALGFGKNDFLVCSFGLLGRTKQNHRLLDAWLASPLASDPRCRLVFVGENEGGEYGKALLKKINQSHCADRIKITGWASGETFRQYLSAADAAVQLRTLDRGETSAAVLDCMNHAIATIANAHGSMAELPDDGVWKLPDAFTDSELVEALSTLRIDAERRRSLGEHARETILGPHSPRTCATDYFTAIERFHRKAQAGIPRLVRAIAQLQPSEIPAEQIRAVADSIARSIQPSFRQRQIFVDISELVQHNAKTGIQRVVRNLLLEWLLHPPAGYRIEPVYADAATPGYRYARDFTLRFLGCPAGALLDDPIEYFPGDIFIGLDLQPTVVPFQRSTLSTMRRAGVRTQFVVYDLLPVRLPNCFPGGAAQLFTRWLDTITATDGAICISRSVASELQDWLDTRRDSNDDPFSIDWFHLGADLRRSSSVSTHGLPAEADRILDTIRSRPAFLIVGTLEPRKGHTQVLDAFDHIWAAGEDVNLVIVGKQGWMMETLADRLRTHPELNKRLFWLEGISDEYLEAVYTASTCLIAASEGEGFGLPLIEAAQHKLPIIAHDIPVFREVAGEHAWFYKENTPESLSSAVIAWLALHAQNNHPTSDGIPWRTWKESAQQLLGRLLAQDHDSFESTGTKQNCIAASVARA